MPKWLDNLMGKGKKPASDNQIRFLRDLYEETDDSQADRILKDHGFKGHIGDDNALKAMTREQVSTLIDAFLNLEPFTDGQGNYITMMYRDLDDWSTGNKDQRYADAYHAMQERCAPHIPNGDYYDRNGWTLSKRQASDIISATKPQWEFLRDLDD